MAEPTLYQLESALRIADGKAQADPTDEVAKADAKGLAAAYTARKAKLDAMPAPEKYDPTGTAQENIAAGVVRSFVATDRGMIQAGEQLNHWIKGKLGVGTQAERDARLQPVMDNAAEMEQLEKPLLESGGGMIGNAVGEGLMMAVPGSQTTKVVKGVQALAAAPKRAAVGLNALGAAGFGAAQPIAEEGSRLNNAALYGVGSAGGTYAAKVVGAAGQPIKNMVGGKVADLAQFAADHGINLRGDQLIKSPAGTWIREASRVVPLSGASAQDAAQLAQLNKAVSKTMGENTSDIGEAVAKARPRLTRQYDDLLSNTDVHVDEYVLDRLATMSDEVKKTLTPAQARQINGQINEIVRKTGDGDLLPARIAHDAKKRLDKIVAEGGSVGQAAKDLRNLMKEALYDSLDDEGKAAFKVADKQWGNMKALERLPSAGAEQEITAARLAGSVHKFSDPELKKLADVAGEFLKAPNANATLLRKGAFGIGTAGAGTAGALGLVSAPMLGGAAMVAGGNRALHSANASQWLTNYMRQGSTKLRAAGSFLDDVFPYAGASAGGLLSRQDQ